MSAVGCSFHERAAARYMLSGRLVDLGLVRYNPSHVLASLDLFPFLEATTPPLFGFRSTHGFVPGEQYADLGLSRRHWRPRLTDHYRFSLTQSGLAGVLCSLHRPEHLEQLVQALHRGPLAEDEEIFLINLAQRRRLKDGGPAARSSE
jgi:hypothetical protein